MSCTTCNTNNISLNTPTTNCADCTAIDRVLSLNETIFYSQISMMVGNCDVANRCKFSWSMDKVNWSCWVSYEDYNKQGTNFDSDFYLRILFKENTIPQLYINNILVNCYSVYIYYTNPFLNDPCSIINNSGFDIYSGWDCALMMQQQLSDQVVCMIGIPIYYFKVNPDIDTKSYTFKEYVLHNVESVKQIKMVVPDGSMPSSKPTISEWDMEFETDWDVELSKTQFATAFGTAAFPKQRDFIWVPMQKRMYMVNTAYEEKNENFMWMATTWKVALVKWQDQDNINLGGFEDVIDSLIVNKYEDVFAEGEKREGELTGTLQIDAPQHISTNLYSLTSSDYIRKQISIDTMKIVDRQINHGNIIVAKNKYIFYKDSSITYQKDWCGTEGTLSLIFDYLTPVTEEKTILSIGDFELKMSGDNILLGNKSLKLQEGKTYIAVMRWGRSVGEVSLSLFTQNHPDMPAYRLKPTMYKFDFTDPTYITSKLDERLISESQLPVVLHGYPLQVANFKLYNRYINDEALDEILKYTTKDEYCIINDQARPIEGEHGYNIR